MIAKVRRVPKHIVRTEILNLRSSRAFQANERDIKRLEFAAACACYNKTVKTLPGNANPPNGQALGATIAQRDSTESTGAFWHVRLAT